MGIKIRILCLRITITKILRSTHYYILKIYALESKSMGENTREFQIQGIK